MPFYVALSTWNPGTRQNPVYVILQTRKRVKPASLAYWAPNMFDFGGPFTTRKQAIQVAKIEAHLTGARFTRSVIRVDF